MKNDWTLKNILKEAKKYKTLKELRENNRSCYVTAHTFGVLREVKKILEVNHFTDQELLKISKKYNSIKTFKIYNKSAYLAILRRKLNYLTHMKRAHKRWDLKSLSVEAQKYIGRGEFQINSPSAYNSALRQKLLDIVCSHMKPQKVGPKFK